MAQSSAFAVDVAQPWGQDFVLTANGDLALLSDSLTTPSATVQRVYRIILHTPRLLDDSGIPVAPPDDWFNVDFGAMVSRSIGRNATDDVLAGIQARILAGIAADPGIAPTPSPTVTVTDAGGGFVLVHVACDTVVGVPIVIPGLRLQIAGG